MARPPRERTLPDRVSDLEDEVYGDPNLREDEGLVGDVRNLKRLEHERDGLVKAARIIALLLGIAIACLTLLEALRRTSS